MTRGPHYHPEIQRHSDGTPFCTKYRFDKEMWDVCWKFLDDCDWDFASLCEYTDICDLVRLDFELEHFWHACRRIKEMIRIHATLPDREKAWGKVWESSIPFQGHPNAEATK